MPHINRILFGAAIILAVSAASVGFTQQNQPGPQERPAGSGMMQGGSGTTGSGMMQGMDCQSMMQGQGGAMSGATDEQTKAMMEHCRSMMGQTPSSGSSTAPATPSAPEKKD